MKKKVLTGFFVLVLVSIGSISCRSLSMDLTPTPLPATETWMSPTSTATQTPLPTMTNTVTITFTPTVTNTPIPTATPLATSTIRESDGMEMMYIYAGEFTMGITQETFDALLEEKEKNGDYWSDQVIMSAMPQHAVYLDAYWIDKYEVNNTQFAAFLNANGLQKFDGEWFFDQENNEYYLVQVGGLWTPKAGYEEVAVGGVGWHAARLYCEWVGARLPTEAEWERAARGTDARSYVWGEEDFKAGMAAFNDYPQIFYPGGSFEMDQSPYGVMDMTGNRREWVNDWYYLKYYEASEYENPQGHQQEYSEHGVKVQRGAGAYDFFPLFGTTYVRFANYPKVTYNQFGFRCAMDANP